MNAKEVSVLAGVSVRTLHHYDRIGLLCPKRNSENGYRCYDSADLDRLQQILFFRTCGMRLSDIANILDRPDYDALEALELQRRSLLHQRQSLDSLLRTLDKTIHSMKGGTPMDNKEKFAGFDFSQNPYEAEARERWGNAAVTRSNDYVAKLSDGEREALGEDMNAYFRTFAAMRGEDPGSAPVVQATAKYCAFLMQFHPYPPEALAGLGQMYVEDERFRRNIDSFGEGTAAFVAKAMELYAKTL